MPDFKATSNAAMLPSSLEMCTREDLLRLAQGKKTASVEAAIPQQMVSGDAPSPAIGVPLTPCAQGRVQLTAKERGGLLGEQPLPSSQNSVAVAQGYAGRAQEARDASGISSGDQMKVMMQVPALA